MGILLGRRHLHRPITRTSGTQWCAPSNIHGWMRGARVLLRPEEVSHLFPMVLTNLGRLAAGDAVAVAMQVLLGGYLRYERDPQSCDTWRSPRRTLMLTYGDCEDLAGVVGSLLIGIGIEATLVVGWWHGEGHAWIEGHDAQGWFLIEGTSGKIHRWYRPTDYAPVSFVTRFGARAA